MVQVYDRKAKKVYDEKQYGEELLNFLYNNAAGRILLKTICINKFFSRLNALYNSGKRSTKKIPDFIEKHNIDMTDFPKEFSSFNDFFARKKLNIKTDAGKNVLISPAESKISVYKICENSKLKIKGTCYDLQELLQDEALAREFSDGICLIFRLSVDNYHRYCYAASGRVSERKTINGKLHTISSISQRYKIYKENQREYEIIDTDTFGRMIQMEVGAMLVGKIVNRRQNNVVQGEEKGHFEYGGSTIVLLMKKNAVKLDEDIMLQNEKGIETKINYGEKIGTAK